MLTQVDLAIIAVPLGRVTVAGIDVRKGDREMNKVEIKVVKSPVLELFLRHLFDLHLKTLVSLQDNHGL